MVRTALVITAALFLVGCKDIFTPGISQAEDAVKARLKDPYSAKFEDVQVCQADRRIIHGYVNSKNSYGAYSGRTLFYAVEGSAYLSDLGDTAGHSGSDINYISHLVEACFGKAKLIPYAQFTAKTSPQSEAERLADETERAAMQTMNMADEALAADNAADNRNATDVDY